MEIDIKCAECGKRTLKFNLGGVYYLVDKPSETVIVENTIICSKDISSGKCMVKGNDLLMMFLTANICLQTGKVPKHLQKILPLNKPEYEILKNKAKARVMLEEKF